MVGKKAGKKGPSAEQRRRRAARASGGGGRDDRSDYKNVRRAEKIAAAEKRSGCLPKLGMFVLPFLLIAAYFILI